MTDPVTYKEFAQFLIDNQHVYYYWPNKTVHSYFRPSGQLCFWANWKGYETRAYTSLKALIESENLPMPERENLTPDIIRPSHRVLTNPNCNP